MSMKMEAAEHSEDQKDVDSRSRPPGVPTGVLLGQGHLQEHRPLQHVHQQNQIREAASDWLRSDS